MYVSTYNYMYLYIIYIYIYMHAHKIKGNLRAPDGFWAPETWADLLALDRLGWGSQRARDI